MLCRSRPWLPILAASRQQTGSQPSWLCVPPRSQYLWSLPGTVGAALLPGWVRCRSSAVFLVSTEARLRDAKSCAVVTGINAMCLHGTAAS